LDSKFICHVQIVQYNTNYAKNSDTIGITLQKLERKLEIKERKFIIFFIDSIIMRTYNAYIGKYIPTIKQVHPNVLNNTLTKYILDHSRLR